MKGMVNVIMENVTFVDRPLFLYRNIDAIRSDISNIKERISEVNRSFSIRELLLEMLSSEENKSYAEWIYDLEALIGEAESAHTKLVELNKELYLLEAELGETGCRIRL